MTFLLWSSGALGLRELWSYSFTRACATSESVDAHSTQTNPAAPLLLSSGAPERESRGDELGAIDVEDQDRSLLDDVVPSVEGEAVLFDGVADHGIGHES